MTDTRDTAERALAKAIDDNIGAFDTTPAEEQARDVLDAILSDPAARRALHEATREDPWDAAMADPAFVAALEQGTSDIEAGRVTPLGDIAALSTPSPDDRRSDAKCSICGRAIFRAWIGGIEQPWKHWVEPVPDGHAATPSPDAATGLRAAVRHLTTQIAVESIPRGTSVQKYRRSVLTRIDAALAASENPSER